MTRDEAAPLTAGDLRIYPDTGEVRDSAGMSIRLSPVNMKVLKHLVERSDRVVLRGELFDLIWKNQSVSDDALTRCISDIRSALAKLSRENKYIETIPKRGYSWNMGVGESSPPIESVVQQRFSTGAVVSEQSDSLPVDRTALIWSRRGLLYAIALVAMASIGAWLADRLSPAGPPIVVVMPTQSDPTHHDLATTIERQISQYFADLDQVALLSKTAIQSRTTNPPSYFYYEFGARWLIESELHTYPEQTAITIAVVDARAGIVLFQIMDQLPDSEQPTASEVEQIFEPVRKFMASQSTF